MKLKIILIIAFSLIIVISSIAINKKRDEIKKNDKEQIKDIKKSKEEGKHEYVNNKLSETSKKRKNENSSNESKSKESENNHDTKKSNDQKKVIPNAENNEILFVGEKVEAEEVEKLPDPEVKKDEDKKKDEKEDKQSKKGFKTEQPQKLVPSVLEIIEEVQPKNKVNTENPSKQETKSEEDLNPKLEVIEEEQSKKDVKSEEPIQKISKTVEPPKKDEKNDESKKDDKKEETTKKDTKTDEQRKKRSNDNEHLKKDVKNTDISKKENEKEEHQRLGLEVIEEEQIQKVNDSTNNSINLHEVKSEYLTTSNSPKKETKDNKDKDKLKGERKKRIDGGDIIDTAVVGLQNLVGGSKSPEIVPCGTLPLKTRWLWIDIGKKRKGQSKK